MVVHVWRYCKALAHQHCASVDSLFASYVMTIELSSSMCRSPVLGASF